MWCEIEKELTSLLAPFYNSNSYETPCRNISKSRCAYLIDLKCCCVKIHVFLEDMGDMEGGSFPNRYLFFHFRFLSGLCRFSYNGFVCVLLCRYTCTLHVLIFMRTNKQTIHSKWCRDVRVCMCIEIHCSDFSVSVLCKSNY